MPASFRKGFTLIEVMIAALILVLLPMGLLSFTIRMSGFARERTERLAAAAFCEDEYNYRILNGNYDTVSWTTISTNSTSSTYTIPWIRVSGSNGDICPFARAGYSKPQYRVVKNGTNNIKVEMRWGPSNNRRTYSQ